jgi:pimeloyl-ACP methyl ester carboxylesterase
MESVTEFFGLCRCRRAALGAPRPDGPSCGQLNLGETRPPALGSFAHRRIFEKGRSVAILLTRRQELARRVMDGRTAVIQAAGHRSSIENPNEFNRVVLAFLESFA